MFLKGVDYLKIHQNTFVILISLIIGVCGGYGAICFRFMINTVQMLAIGSGEDVLDIVRHTPWFIKLFIPSIGGLIVGPMVYFFAREAKGHGVPEVMEAVALRGGRIRPRVVAIKALASAITLGTGGSVGREGPIVQIGSAIGSTVGQLLKFPPERVKILVACGASAGIAATFNAPITGVLFAIEIILGNFAIHTFSPLVVSSVIATVISRHHLGDIPSFIVPVYELKSPWELPLYLIMGTLVAGVGLLFMNAIHWMEDLFRRFRIPEYLKPATGLIGMGALICFFPHVYGNGYQTITLSLSNNLGFWIMLSLIPIKILATSLTLGAGGSGGVFAPSLFIGGITGGAFGKLVHYLFPAVTGASGAYAMVGMGAMVGAVTHAPVTAIITLFELTNDYKIILPLMATCIFATMITSTLRKDSIYTAKLSRRGVNLNMGLESAVMNRNTVQEIMHVNIRTIDPETPFERLYNDMINCRENHYYVVELDGTYQGEISPDDIIQVLNVEGIGSRRKAADLIDRSYPNVSPDTTLMQCIRIFCVTGVQELPVVDITTHQFLGIISYRDIFTLYNREILREGTLGLKFVTRSEAEPRSDYVNIPDGYSVELIPVVGKMADRSIRDLELRGKYDITIVAIKPPEGREISSEIPSPDRILTRRDALIVVGRRENILRMRKELMH